MPNWTQTTATTWRADCDGAILYVTQRRRKGLFDTYWPTVNIAGRFIPLVGVDSLEEAKAACEAEVQGVTA